MIHFLSTCPWVLLASRADLTDFHVGNLAPELWGKKQLLVCWFCLVTAMQRNNTIPYWHYCTRQRDRSPLLYSSIQQILKSPTIIQGPILLKISPFWFLHIYWGSTVLLHTLWVKNKKNLLMSEIVLKPFVQFSSRLLRSCQGTSASPIAWSRPVSDQFLLFIKARARSVGYNRRQNQIGGRQQKQMPDAGMDVFRFSENHCSVSQITTTWH